MEKQPDFSLVNIGCATDNNYAQHLGVMMYSLLANCKKTDKVCFYIADGGIADSNKEKLNELAIQFGCCIHYIIPDLDYFKGLKIFESYGLATYFRFYLIENCPVDKILFLDCDMIVEKDVTPLYEFELGQSIIATVPDILVPEVHMKQLELQSYFNAGLMLIDSKKWKAFEVSKKCIEFSLSKPHLMEYADQDPLNVVLKDQWKVLPLYWNVLSKLKFYKYGLTSVNKQAGSKKEVSDALEDPYIVHYANRIFKPWNWLDPSPFKKNYIHYLRLSPWKNNSLQGKSISGVFSRFIYYFSFSIRYFLRYVKK